MKTISRLLLIFFSCFLWMPTANAQTVYAQVSSKRVQVGVPFEYAIVISVSANSYAPPNFREFEVVSGPNQSSSIQYVNGAVTQQMTISWGLVARKEGKYTIGPAMVTAGGQRFETQPVSVEAVKGAPGPAAAGETRGGDVVAGDDLFIRTTISKNRIYLGEQITIVQKVYSRHQIIGYQKSNPPSYDGFYSQSQDSPTRGQLIMENVDGVNYYTHEIFRTVATANKSGKITLSPIELVPIIRKQTAVRPRTIFEQFFGGASYEDIPVPVKSKAQVVEVLPLPEEGRPENFNGGVGNFSMKTEVSRTTLKANEAFNLKMTISGRGNLKLLNAPKLALPESFETYEPRVSEGVNSKTFDYLIIPRQEGDYQLSGISFSYFNLDTKKYATLNAGDVTVKVLPPDPGSSGAQVYSLKSQVKQTENDIRYIKKGEFELQKTRREFFNSPLHAGLMVTPVAGLFLAWMLRRAHIRSNSDIVLVRERKAAGMARRQLRQAEKKKQQGLKDEFYAEVLMAINKYLGYKLRIPVADISRERVLSELGSRNIDPSVKDHLVATINTAEYARYAPGAVSGDLDKVYRDTVNLITNLDQQLSKKQS